MARDPPNPSPALLDASPNLRDLSLNPSAVKAANPVIIHPQLRDLILPLERGRVLYPRGGAIEELTWTSTDREDATDEGDEVDMGDGGHGSQGNQGEQSARTLVKLNFTPNCLIANKTILAAGGQHGELYITNVPLRSGHNASRVDQRLAERFPVKPLNPFTINLSLQSRSINNSMILLPTYPTDWARQADERRIGYRGRRASSITARTQAQQQGSVERDEMDDEVMDLDEEDEDGTEGEEEDEEDEDGTEGEEEDDDDDDEDQGEEPQSPLTYPNTVPFQHAPRIPHLPTQPSWTPDPPSPASASRRTASFSDRLRDRDRDRERELRPTRLERQSFSIPRPGTGMPPIEYVTSRPIAYAAGAGIVSGARSPRSDASAASSRHRFKQGLQRHGALKGHNPRIEGVIDEPRLLISNNDLTVKMFSLRSVPPTSASTGGNTAMGLNSSGPRQHRYIPLSRSYTTQRGRDDGTIEQTFDDWTRTSSATTLEPTASQLGRETLNRQLSEFQRIVGMRVTRPMSIGNPRIGSPMPASSPPPPVMTESKDREERKLVRIGGSKFKCAINHSSLSPDLKNMVSVGDSEEVYLFEVVDGGREFRKVATYKAATDSGFSTAWSRDGRKFAAASQDGQVTVWDHRSSKPLAKFYSSRGTSSLSNHPPSFSSDLHMSRLRDSLRSPPILVDPVTGDTRSGSSLSGREAARVVKFSPEGAPRDLLVFTEENTNVHIIDAQTLDTHVVLPVPSHETGAAIPRSGHEGGTWGIAGVAFDPTGQWLYSGTERTVVEWDLRGGPGSQGVWGMR